MAIASEVIYASNVPDCSIPSNVSCPEFTLKYSPELVPNDKSYSKTIVHPTRELHMALYARRQQG